MQKSAVTPVESYHVQHSPFGAFASFTIGLVDSPGGFGQSLRGPAKQNLYIGYRKAAQKEWQLLPFLTPPKSLETAFTADTTVVQPPRGFQSLTPADYVRTLGWASDTWRADGARFGLSLLSPFGPVPDPAKIKKADARFHLAPLTTGWIEYDNRDGQAAVELIFGVGNGDDTLRPLTDTAPDLAGFASGGRFGYATKPGKDVAMRQGFNVLDPKFHDWRNLLVIAGETGLVFTVPAGKKKRFPLVLGFYAAGPVTTGLTASYFYTRFFRDLEDVLGHGLAEYARYEKLAARRDAELARSKLDADQRFLLAQSTHSYLGSTQLLWHKNRPLWVVNEGEYRMINTFDLTVDHLFYELAWHPWSVRDALDLFSRRYSYRDQHGLSFTHDMGVNDFFTPPGRSSYECDNIEGCFSHMTMEQLLNWVLCACTYAAHTGDRAWLKANRKTLLACVDSLHRRDHPDPRQRDGLLKQDSNRVGIGAEITTYDSLDVSLGQARNNLYLGVKTLGAWVLLEKTLAGLGDAQGSADARARRPPCPHAHHEVRDRHRFLPGRVREGQPLAHPARGRGLRVSALPRLQGRDGPERPLRPALPPAPPAHHPGPPAGNLSRRHERRLEDEQHEHEHLVQQDRPRAARHPPPLPRGDECRGPRGRPRPRRLAAHPGLRPRRDVRPDPQRHRRVVRQPLLSPRGHRVAVAAGIIPSGLSPNPSPPPHE
jgi:hypothetical protein